MCVCNANTAMQIHEFFISDEDIYDNYLSHLLLLLARFPRSECKYAQISSTPTILIIYLLFITALIYLYRKYAWPGIISAVTTFVINLFIFYDSCLFFITINDRKYPLYFRCMYPFRNIHRLKRRRAFLGHNGVKFRASLNKVI